MNRITVEVLLEHRACPMACEVFAREWPDGAEVTLENALRAFELRLYLYWARRLMSPAARHAYDEVTAPARRAYNEAIATARRAYEEGIAPAWVRGILS